MQRFIYSECTDTHTATHELSNAQWHGSVRCAVAVCSPDILLDRSRIQYIAPGHRQNYSIFHTEREKDSICATCPLGALQMVYYMLFMANNTVCVWWILTEAYIRRMYTHTHIHGQNVECKPVPANDRACICPRLVSMLVYIHYTRAHIHLCIIQAAGLTASIC